MSFKLSGTDGRHFYSWALEPGEYLIGRKSECNFCVPHRTVSRQHAKITVDSNNRIIVTDLGSHNGTFVNGRRLTSPVELNSGDKVLFGQTEFKVGIPDISAVAGQAENLSSQLADEELLKSRFLSINEALRPLTGGVSTQQDLLGTMFDMAKLLVYDEPREMMLHKSLEIVAGAIPAERLAVLFVSDDGHDVRAQATLLKGIKDPGAFRLSSTIVQEIMTQKNSIVIGDPKNDPRFARQQSIILSELKSAVAVPLFDEGKVLGILYADTSNPAHSYDDNHLRIMATFGNIIASRLLNYELLDERHKKQIMDAELNRAAQIQKNLIIKEPPPFEGYDIYAYQEQSYSVGGDLYDIAVLPDGRLLFLLADVSGKGLGAALLMSNILASFRILYGSDNPDLREMVVKVSQQMHKYSAPGHFATLFIGILDNRQNVLHFVNAGHNPPYLVRADGSLEQLKASGIMIGAFDFADWDIESRTIDKGDLLFVFTDGITEAENDKGLFGDKRTQELVINHRTETSRGLTEKILDEINGYLGDSPQSDDITTIAIKRVGI
jgi:sigma-B regulation protein RsbU (phosphoserine phosphatase)